MRTPPRLIVRTLAVTLVTVTAILAVVFLVLTSPVLEPQLQELLGRGV